MGPRGGLAPTMLRRTDVTGCEAGRTVERNVTSRNGLTGYTERVVTSTTGLAILRITSTEQRRYQEQITLPDHLHGAATISETDHTSGSPPRSSNDIRNRLHLRITSTERRYQEQVGPPDHLHRALTITGTDSASGSPPRSSDDNRNRVDLRITSTER